NTGVSVSRRSSPMIKPHRHPLAGADREVEVDDLGICFRSSTRSRAQASDTIAADNVCEFESPVPDSFKIVSEPVRKLWVEVDDFAPRVGKKETRRHTVEIINRTLRPLERDLPMRERTGHVVDAPHGESGTPPAPRERLHADPDPACLASLRRRQVEI